MKTFVVAMKDLREKLLTRTFAIGMILCCLLVPVTVGAMVRLYDARLEDYWRNTDRERYEMSGLTSWTRLMWRGMALDMRPSPLLVLAVGVERNVQSRVRLDSNWAYAAYEGAGGGNPLLAESGGMDYGAVVRVVMSLLTILLLHDSVAGEKEGGTLRLLLATGVPRDAVIVGKYLGGMVAVATPFLVGTLLGLIILVWSLPGEFLPEHMVRGAVLLGVSLLYLSAFALLSLFVSACFDRASTALTALLLVWVLLVLVVPKASVLVARAAVKTKSEAELAGEVRSLLDNVSNDSNRMWRQWRQQEENRDKPWSERWQKLQEIRNRLYEVASRKIQRLRREYFRGLERQTSFAKNLSRLSPASNLMYVAMSLARTDAERSHEYLQAADNYREMARRVVSDLSALEDANDIWEGRYRRLGPIDLRLLPGFSFREAGLLESIRHGGVDLGILLGLNILLLMLSHLAFLRYSPV